MNSKIIWTCSCGYGNYLNLYKCNRCSSTRIMNNSNSVSHNLISHNTNITESNNTNDCIICMTNVATTAFIHERIGHKICCEMCASEIYRRGDTCPLCRKNIENIAKIF